MDHRAVIAAFGDDDQSPADIRRILRAVMTAFGGPETFGREIVADYKMLEAGHPSRVRIASDLLRAIGTYGDQEASDDEDVEVLKARAKQLMQELDGGQPDNSGTAEPPGDAET